jgi:hypothetical protein
MLIYLRIMATAIIIKLFESILHQDLHLASSLILCQTRA